MGHLPFFIPTRDRLTCLQQLLVRLRDLGQPPDLTWIVDMDSTFDPMNEFLHEIEDRDGYRVMRLGNNWGARGLFQRGIIKKFVGKGPFFLSDPDVVPEDDVRKDLLGHMQRCLDRYPAYHKIGMSLRIDDLPDHYPEKQRVIDWESRFSVKPVNHHLFEAGVATTFTIVRSIAHTNHLGDVGQSARLRDGMAKHTAWYLDPNNLPPDEAHYYRHAPKRPAGSPTPGTSWRVAVDE